MRISLLMISMWALQLSVNAQQLEEILQSHFKAAAQDKMGKMETIITYGKNHYSAGGIESSFTIYQARPNKIRIESQFQGSEVIQTYNGKQGWMAAPSMGIPDPKKMNNNEMKSLLNQAEFENPLWRATEEGDSLELVETGPDYPADHIKLITGSGEIFHFFIDRDNHLISSIRSTQVLRGNSTEITTILKEYKSTRGIPIARQIQTRMNGETVTTIEIEKVEFNKNIDSTLFEKPLIAPAASPPGEQQ